MSQLSIKSALHTAIDNLPALIPASDIQLFSGGVLTTLLPHGLLTGTNVKITGSNFDGSYIINVLDQNSFTLQSVVDGSSVVTAPSAGGTVTPQLTAWPNVPFDPVPGLPYQKVNVIFSRPEEPTAGTGFYREIGLLQVTLYYPLLQGDWPAMSRAELIRNAFPKGSSVIKDDTVVQFNNVAQIIDGVSTDESYIVIVRVPFYANIFS